jgi:hypothetical protein
MAASQFRQRRLFPADLGGAAAPLALKVVSTLALNLTFSLMRRNPD